MEMEGKLDLTPLSMEFTPEQLETIKVLLKETFLQAVHMGAHAAFAQMHKWSEDLDKDLENGSWAVGINLDFIRVDNMPNMD